MFCEVPLSVVSLELTERNTIKVETQAPPLPTGCHKWMSRPSEVSRGVKWEHTGCVQLRVQLRVQKVGVV